MCTNSNTTPGSTHKRGLIRSWIYWKWTECIQLNRVFCPSWNIITPNGVHLIACCWMGSIMGSALQMETWESTIWWMNTLDMSSCSHKICPVSDHDLNWKGSRAGASSLCDLTSNFLAVVGLVVKLSFGDEPHSAGVSGSSLAGGGFFCHAPWTLICSNVGEHILIRFNIASN
jgi:hypothetical protein